MGLILAVVIVGCLTAMSGAGYRRWRGHERLPMQWGFDGKPTWSATRGWALALTPALAALVLLLIALLPASKAEDRLSAIAFIGGSFVAAHLLHLWLIKRRLG